jgi:hypothetical protein
LISSFLFVASSEASDDVDDVDIFLCEVFPYSRIFSLILSPARSEVNALERRQNKNSIERDGTRRRRFERGYD